MTLTERLNIYERLMRLDKPIGILLLLWPTLWGLWISAAGQPDWVILWVFVIGTVLMRSAGCVINDYADREFDPHVERTRHRPLAAGMVQPWEALVLAAMLALTAFVMILWLNALTIQLALVAALLAASYPFTKRFLPIPQAYLGIAFGFGIPMAFAAQTGEVPAVAWVMLVANVFWSVAYDTEYAMVDRDDDARVGIHTSALTLGRWDVPAVMVCYAIMLVLLLILGLRLSLLWPYYAGLAAAATMMAYHFQLIRTRSREGSFKAFMHNNWVGAAVFVGLFFGFR